MRPGRLLLWFGAALLLLAVVIAIAAGWAVHTESGARWALKRAANASGAMRFDDVSGTLFGRLDVGSVHYADESAELAAQGISLQVDPDRLLAGELHVRELTAEALSYTPRPTTGKKKTGAPPSLPIDLTVDDVRIGRIVIHGDRDEQIDNVAARAQWRGDMITIESLALTVRDFEIQLAGTVRLRERPVIDLNADWRSLADSGLHGSGQVTGDTASLAVQHELAGRYAVSTRGTVDYRDNSVHLDLVNTADQLDHVAGERKLQFSDASLSIKGPLDNYRISLNTALASPGLPALQISGSGNGNLQSLQVADLSVTPPRGRLSGSGELRWAPAVFWRFDVSANDINPALFAEQWPGNLAGGLRFSGNLDEAGLRYQARDIDIRGTLRDKQLALSGQVQLAGNVIEIHQLQLRAGAGSINSVGQVNLGEPIRWQTDLSLRDVNPAFLFDDWPGQLSGSVRFGGSYSTTGTRFVAENIAIDGRLRDQPLQLGGTLRHDGTALSLSRVNVRSGNNRLRIDGSFGRRLAVEYNANITDLGAFGPQFDGSLTGEGRLAGTLAAPVIEVDLVADGLRVPGYAIGTLRADGQLAPRGRQATLLLEAGEVALGEQRIDSVRATVRGALDQHEIALELATPLGRVNASLAGGWQDEQWRGQLADSRFDLQQYGLWQQQSAATVTAAVAGAQVRELCWRQDTAAVCIDGGIDGGVLAASANVREVPVDTLRRFLPPGTTADGAINASATLRGTTKNPLLEFSAGAAAVDFSYRYAEDEEPVTTTVEDITLSGTASLEQLAAKLSLSGPDDAALLFDGELMQWRGTGPQVSAHLDASLPDASLLGLLSTRINNVTGSLRADGRIDGDARRPNFTGFVRLENAGATIPAAGISLDDVQLELRPAGSGKVGLTGAANSSGGRITLDGTLQLDAAAGWPLSGAITGERFTAVRLPGIDVVVSPDLQLGGNIRELMIKGDVVADRAIIEFKELPEQAVRISPDVVVAGDGQTETPRESMLQLAAELNVELGEEVSFSGFGLRTGLDGELALRLIPGRPPQGRGLITLESGRFQA
ncbi:MAG: hypothetical protein HKN06_07450, partial [Gammaproteobacteria bacterium]|nr:hypothetical protein [Gammaproteobacteria bacterium]